MDDGQRLHGRRSAGGRDELSRGGAGKGVDGEKTKGSKGAGCCAVLPLSSLGALKDLVIGRVL